MSTEAQKKAWATYNKKLKQYVFKLDPTEHGDVIEFWESQENKRQKFIEVTRELIERERT